MGRGRAKAKQTKVARDLKYRTFDTDFSSLERELRGESADTLAATPVPESEEPSEYDEYADRWAGNEDDEGEGDASSRASGY